MMKALCKKLPPHIASWLPSVCALLLFILAGLSFAQAINSPVTISQPIFGALITFVIVTTVCWEWKIFGNPDEKKFLLAHVGFGFAVFFLINSLFARHPKTDSLLDKILNEASEFANVIAGIPPAFFDMLHSPGVLLLFLGTCVALSMNTRTWAIGVLILVAFLTLVFGMIRNVAEYPLWILLGLVFFFFGIIVIRRDYSIDEFWSSVKNKLEGDDQLKGDLELKKRLLKKLYNNNNGLTSKECCGTVARALGMETSNPEAEAMMIRVVRLMVEQDNIAVLTYNYYGKQVLALRPDMQRVDNNDTWTSIARVPKIVVVGLIAVVWILSPIDLIPDSIPFFGVIDDVLVALFGARVVFLGSSEAKRDSGPGARIENNRNLSQSIPN